jgi:hypothetical protein
MTTSPTAAEAGAEVRPARANPTAEAIATDVFKDLKVMFYLSFLGLPRHVCVLAARMRYHQPSRR